MLAIRSVEETEKSFLLSLKRFSLKLRDIIVERRKDSFVEGKDESRHSKCVLRVSLVTFLPAFEIVP